MIKGEDIKKLADLARIGVEDIEAESLAGEIDAILGYVGQVSHVASQASAIRDGEDAQIKNVMRPDENPTEPGTYSKELIAEFPESENGYLKVKKIL